MPFVSENFATESNFVDKKASNTYGAKKVPSLKQMYCLRTKREARTLVMDRRHILDETTILCHCCLCGFHLFSVRFFLRIKNTVNQTVVEIFFCVFVMIFSGCPVRNNKNGVFGRKWGKLEPNVKAPSDYRSVDAEKFE